MLAHQLEEMTKAWFLVSQTVRVPHTEGKYRELTGLLDALTDEVGKDESQPLAPLMDVIGVLIEKYKDEHVPLL